MLENKHALRIPYCHLEHNGGKAMKLTLPTKLVLWKGFVVVVGFGAENINCECDSWKWLYIRMC